MFLKKINALIFQGVYYVKQINIEIFHFFVNVGL